VLTGDKYKVTYFKLLPAPSPK